MTLPPGHTVELTKEITQSLVDAYARVSGDDNPIHVDPEFAKHTAFGGTIAHGMLVGGLFSAALANDLFGHGAIYLGQTLTFKAPILVGETVRLRLTIMSVRPDKPIYTVSTTCLGLDERVLVSGEAIIKYDQE